MIGLFLKNTKTYWDVKLILRKLKFMFYSRLVNFKNWYEAKQNFSTFWGFLIRLIFPIITVIFTIVIIELAESRFGIASFVQQHLSFLSNKDGRPDNSIYSDLLTIFGAIAGIYFATASIVITNSSYSKLSMNSIDIIWSLKPYRFFFDFLVVHITFCLCIMLFNGAGYNTGWLLYISTQFLSLLAIPMFGMVSLQIFSLMSPFQLLYDKIIPDTLKWAKKATIKGQYWNNQDIQNYYRSRVESGFEIADNIIGSLEDTKKLRTMSNEDISQLVETIFKLLYSYSIHKQRIPRDSYWFKRAAKHKRWFEAPSHIIEMAMKTGTSLSHDAVPDYLWFEKRIAKLLVVAIRSSASRNNYELPAVLLYSMQKYVDAIINNGTDEAALYIVKQINNSYQEILLNISPALEKVDENNIDEKIVGPLTVADSYGMSVVSVLVGYIGNIEKYKKTAFEAKINSLKWNDPEEIYEHGFPQGVVQELNSLHKKLQFETKVEGKIITSNWYINQLIASSVLNYIETVIINTKNLIEKYYVDYAKELYEKKGYYIALQIIDRGFEACSKANTLANVIEAVEKDLNEFIKAEDVPHKKIDCKKFRKDISAINDDLIELFAKLTPVMSILPQSDSIPDYFGRAYWCIADECFFSIIENKAELFKKIFPAFFNHVIEASKQLFDKYDQTNNQYWFNQASDVIKDLLVISGYALIYKELGQEKAWKTVNEKWEGHFSQMEDLKLTPEKWIIAIIEMVANSNPLYGVTNRSMRQMNWETACTHDFEKRELITNQRSYFDYKAKNEHSSKIIQKILNSITIGSWSTNVENFFVADFLIPKIKDKKKLNLSYDMRSLFEYLNNEEDDSEKKK